ncbi:MAG: hypothetical protein PHG03_00145 [Bacilli bacterium]|nr:hypothetical protein [Bacilli bacterium]MDD4794961.1 hypothetical protein [Bacilli bacterium]
MTKEEQLKELGFSCTFPDDLYCNYEIVNDYTTTTLFFINNNGSINHNKIITLNHIKK